MSFYEHEYYQMQAYCQKVKFTIIDKKGDTRQKWTFLKDIIFEQLVAFQLIGKDWMKFYYIINFEQIIFEEVL